MRNKVIEGLTRPWGMLVCVAILTVQAIREKMSELTDRVQAIIDLANEATRDLTDEERKEIDAIMGVGKKGEAGHKPGQLDALEADLNRAETLEARQAEMAARRSGPHPAGGGQGPLARSDGPGGDRPDPPDTPRAQRVVIPATARYRHAGLRAFHGEHAEQEAYLTGMFLMASILRDERAATWCREHGVEIRMQQAGGNNPLGGFLVPMEMERRIIELRENYGVFRREADVTPMGSDTLDTPVRRTGVTANFVGENQEITDSELAWGQVTLTARKLGALVRFSSEISEDAIISIADKITDEIAYAFALREDQCGFIGAGGLVHGGIVGLLNAIQAGSRVTPVAGAGTISFRTLLLENFETMVGLLPQYAEVGAKWFISKVGFAASMQRLMDAAGGNTIDMLEGGPSGRQFLGYPVVISQVLNNTLANQASTNGLCYLGNLQLGALMGTRRGITIVGSDQRYFEFDQLAVRGTERFDINIHGRGDANDPGPIIQLSTPAN